MGYEVKAALETRAESKIIFIIDRWNWDGAWRSVPGDEREQLELLSVCACARPDGRIRLKCAARGRSGLCGFVDSVFAVCAGGLRFVPTYIHLLSLGQGKKLLHKLL